MAPRLLLRLLRLRPRFLPLLPVLLLLLHLAHAQVLCSGNSSRSRGAALPQDVTLQWGRRALQVSPPTAAPLTPRTHADRGTGGSSSSGRRSASAPLRTRTRGRLRRQGGGAGVATAEEATVPLGGGYPPLSAPAFRRLQRDVDCWDNFGSWQRDEDPRAWSGAHTYGYLGPPAGGGAVRDVRNFSLAREALAALPVTPYVWSPPRRCAEKLGAPFLQFNRSAFCAALGGRSILMLGDSLSAGMHDALVELLGGAGIRYERPSAKGHHCPGRLSNGSPCGGHVFCGGTVRVVFRRTDHLLFNRPGTTDFGFLTRGAGGTFVRRPQHRIPRRGRYHLPIHDLLPGPGTPGARFDIVLVNRGAHFVNTPTLLGELRSSLRFLRAGGATPQQRRSGAIAASASASAAAASAWRPPLIIFRSTTHGHAGCRADSVPLSPWGRATKLAKRAACAYNWCQISQQTVDVRRLVREEFPGVVFLDVSRATSLREDMHENPLGADGKEPRVGKLDCLHYQGLGPYDHWVRALFNVVVRLGREEGAGGKG